MYLLDPAPPKLPPQEYIDRYLSEKEDKYIAWYLHDREPMLNKLAQDTCQRYGMPEHFADIKQAAVCGILAALGKYDPSIGAPFAAFQKQYISDSIEDYIRAAQSGVVTMTVDTYPVMKRIMAIYHRNGDDSSDGGIQTIADEVGMDAKTVKRYIAIGALNERRADFYQCYDEDGEESTEDVTVDTTSAPDKLYFRTVLYAEAANGALWADPESPFRVKKYDPATKGFTILKSSEVQKMYETVQREMREIEHKIAAHLAEMPTAQDASSVSDGLPWIKTLYELCDRKDIIEDVLENLGKAASTPDIYKFKESDTLTVFGDEDTCREAGHLLKKITVDFSFYGKANKQFTIQRCSHCKQFRISLSDLLHMFESYGVPRGKIAYENDTAGDFSGFADASVFYNMGYTVSQSVGLHASERQSILKCAIDAGKASKYEVMSFLKRRMNINGMKAGNELAFQKWKEDLEYIRSL